MHLTLVGHWTRNKSWPHLRIPSAAPDCSGAKTVYDLGILWEETFVLGIAGYHCNDASEEVDGTRSHAGGLAEHPATIWNRTT